MNKEANPFEESRRITKILFDEIYAKEFNGRAEFEEFVIDIVRKNKMNGLDYTFSSIYIAKQYNFHVNITNKLSYSVTTFQYYMIWDDTKFSCSHNTDNISTYIGTPAYWFISPEFRVKPDYVDYKTIDII